MAKLNKWANIIKNVAEARKGQGRLQSKARRNDSVSNMNPNISDVANGNTSPKKSLGVMNKAFENMAKKKTVNPAFDIFPEDMQSQMENQTDKEINQEVDNNKTGVETYLSRKNANRKKTPTTYNDEQYAKKTGFSSPDETQEIVEPTNTDMSDFDEVEGAVTDYADPIISTLPTPTSEKMGVPRPGPSTFIKTAKYNPQSKRLNVEYTDGTIFPYENVSQEMADKILTEKAAHSPGRTMLDTIFYGHGTTKADEIQNIEEGM